MRLAVIPARGGSKRIPRKNVRSFCGKPMIVWSIEAAHESGCFDRIIVSTDDDEIARVATDAGAEAPFMRPAELADDHTATRPVINHAIHEAGRLFGPPELVCCIYPAAPFIKAADLCRALDLMTREGADFAFPVTSFASPIQRALRVTDSGRLAMFWPEHLQARSQDLEPAHHDAGQFYWGRANAWLEGKATSDGGVPLVLPRHRVVDIDTEEDWEQAELLFKVVFGEGGS